MTWPSSDPRPGGDQSDFRELRQRAETRIAAVAAAAAEGTPVEVRTLIHELGVHQIELEMQNEQLRQTQAALEVVRTRYLDLFEDAPIAYLTISASGRLISCNQRGLAILRISSSSIDRRRITEFLTPGSQSVFAEERDRLLATGLSQAFDLEMRRSDGSVFWASIQMSTAMEEVAGTVVYRIALSDITDRRRMEEAAARLAAIVTSADLAILSTDLTGIVTSWNAGAGNLFGYPSMVGTYSRVLVPDDRPDEDAIVISRARLGDTFTLETVRVRQDGTPIPVSLTASPIVDEYGRISGVSQVIRDISEQASSRAHLSMLLAELREREQQLHEADRRKDEFIATLAHELRNPLAPIRNSVAVLRHIPGLRPEAEWCREVIDRQVGLMSELLEDLLDVSRITRRMVTIHRDRVVIQTAVAQAIETNQPIIESRKHRLRVTMPEEPIEITGDLTRLVQVIGNILNNAAKYTDAEGEISILVEARPEMVEIRIKDSGIGISSEHASRIFELFSQVSSALDRSQGGLGIGLFLVKGLVDLHGGTVEVSSAGVGAGTEFVVSLPRGAPERAASGSGETGSTAPADLPVAGRILVADDNEDEATSLSLLLRHHGYSVETAGDGLRAVELAERFAPEILLLDLGMPKLNGYEVAKRVRAEAWGREMIVIAYSGWGRPEDRARSKEAGVDHHLSKPVAPARLLELFASTLASRRSHGDP